MPQVRFRPDPQVRFTPDPEKPSLMDAVMDYLPSRRTALQAGGATIGGVIGSAAGGPFGTIVGGSLGAGAGESLEQAIARWRGEEDAPASWRESSAGLAEAMTLGAGQEAIGWAIPAAARATARGLYRSMLKPSTKLTVDEANRVTQTLLDKRIPVADKGLEKLDQRVGGINNAVDASIATRPNAPIMPTPVASRADPLIQRLRYEDVPTSAEAVEANKAAFLARHQTPAVPAQPWPPPSYGGRTPMPGPMIPRTPPQDIPIPATQAQTMKKAIYRELGKAPYGSLAPGYEESQKQIARGLKEELEALFPNLQGLNAEEGLLLEARPELNRAINRTANQDVLGIGGPLTAAAVEAMTGHPKLALAAGLLKNAGSKTAIYLNELARPQLKMTPLAGAKFILPYAADRAQWSAKARSLARDMNP